VELVESSRSGDAKHIFILITDAPPHVPTNSGKTVRDICHMLTSRGITAYVAARRDRDSIEAYDPVTRGGGKFYDLNDKFYDILDSIAHSIADLIRL
jgi:Mg-chelatase subunit ChlD